MGRRSCGRQTDRMHLTNITATTTKRISVFFVEDSQLVRERLEVMATGAGASTAGHATGAQSAIRAILATHPDIVVTDLKLVEGNGFDVLRAIHEAAPEIELYMLSNFATEPYRRLARDLGARDFFDKSTEFRRVGEIIAALTAAANH